VHVSRIGGTGREGKWEKVPVFRGGVIWGGVGGRPDGNNPYSV
jgi:hypothetical protein